MDFSISVRRDDVIFVVDPEIMDIRAAEEIADAMESYAEKLRSDGKPVLILVDASPLKSDDAQTRRYMVNRTSKMDFDRLAVFGTSALQAQAANLMLLAAHLIMNNKVSFRDKVKLFSSNEAAEEWLTGR